jgi:hypothetical protein
LAEIDLQNLGNLSGSKTFFSTHATFGNILDLVNMRETTGQILDGKALAQKMQDELHQEISKLQPTIGRPPGLAVLMVRRMSAVKRKPASKPGLTPSDSIFPPM